MTPDQFENLISEEKFIEYTKCITSIPLLNNLVSNNYYGTSIAAVEAIAETGRRCILDIEMEVLPIRMYYLLTSGCTKCEEDHVECPICVY